MHVTPSQHDAQRKVVPCTISKHAFQRWYAVTMLLSRSMYRHYATVSLALRVVFILLFYPSVYGQDGALGVTPTLCEEGDKSCEPLLIEPTTVPSYVGCIKNVGEGCVNGNGVRAQAPFDPSTACPTTPIYGPSGFLVDRASLQDQAR